MSAEGKSQPDTTKLMIVSQNATLNRGYCYSITMQISAKLSQKSTLKFNYIISFWGKSAIAETRTRDL